MKPKDFTLNTFLVGAQKSATTSFYSWLSEHPEVCAPMSMKDFPFFVRESNFEKGLDLLWPAYREAACMDRKIRMQGCVQYMFYPEAIRRIANYAPDAKILMILRNPIERAISAYRYFKKMKLENHSFSEAIAMESERLASLNFRVRSELTYLSHGLYGKQLKEIYDFFPKEQVLVLLYSQVKDQPKEAVKNAFAFLGIDPDYVPTFQLRNQTGKVRSPWLQKAVFGKNTIRKKMVNLVDPVFPIHQRNKWRLWLKEWNTRPDFSETFSLQDSESQLLSEFFRQDIALLEQLTGYDLSQWKN